MYTRGAADNVGYTPNIRELRKQLGFRQEDIATMLGVTRQTILLGVRQRFVQKKPPYYFKTLNQAIFIEFIQNMA